MRRFHVRHVEPLPLPPPLLRRPESLAPIDPLPHSLSPRPCPLTRLLAPHGYFALPAEKAGAAVFLSEDEKSELLELQKRSASGAGLDAEQEKRTAALVAVGRSGRGHCGVE